MTITIEQGITIEPGIVLGNGPMIIPKITHTITPNGNAQISTSQFKFGTGSYTNNSLSGYLSVTPYADFAFGTGDFTVEFWYRPTAISSIVIPIGFRPVGVNGNYPLLVMNNSSQGALQYYVNGYRITTPSVFSLNTWSSVALVRYSGSTKLYVNGTQAGSTYVDATNYLAGSCIIGANEFTLGANSITGFMDEIRISNIARYTGNYTPATQPFMSDNNTLLLLHCDGTNNSTIFTDSSNTI